MLRPPLSIPLSTFSLPFLPPITSHLTNPLLPSINTPISQSQRRHQTHRRRRHQKRPHPTYPPRDLPHHIRLQRFRPQRLESVVAGAGKEDVDIRCFARGCGYEQRSQPRGCGVLVDGAREGEEKDEADVLSCGR